MGVDLIFHPKGTEPELMAYLDEGGKEGEWRGVE